MHQRARASTPRAHASATGAILPLLLILIIPILALLALVVDLGVVMNSNRDLEQKTRNAALSALSAFQDEYRAQNARDSSDRGCGGTCEMRQDDPGLIPCCAMHAAHQRAEEVAFTNISLGEKFSRDPESLIETFSRESEPSQSGIPDESEFRLGKYYWFKPDECSHGNLPGWCPEDPDGYPFFRTLNLNSSTELQQANAIELTATFPESNPITAIFAGILGTREFRVHALARAAILPRNDMFLIDLSRSMYRTNYFLDPKHTADYPDDPPGSPGSPGSAAEFAYLTVDGALPCTTMSAITAQTVCCASSCSGDPDYAKCISLCTIDACDSYIQYGSGYSRDQLRWAAMFDGPPYITDEGVLESERHYTSQYRCTSITTEWSETTSSTQNYLFDFGSNTIVMEARPEPLFSVLEATNSALTNLQSRNMSVDRFGAIGFDDDESNLISRNPRLLLPSPPGSPSIAEWVDATNTAFASVPFRGFMKKALFPFAGAKSDIFQPLREAAYLISLEPSYKVAKNSINIFSDGLQNCVYAGNGGDWWSGWERQGSCLNNGVNVIQGIMNLTDPTFVDELKRRQISVNMILFGDEVRPHKLVRKNSSETGCVDQIEDNAQGPSANSFVDSDWEVYVDELGTDPELLNDQFTSKSATSPFLASNYLYEGLVAPTKGLWLPVMPPYEYTDPVSGDTRGINFWGKMQYSCREAANTNPIPNLSITPNNPFNPEETLPFSIVVTDAQGRLLYDPLGESVADQMRRFVDQIIQSPYVLVP